MDVTTIPLLNQIATGFLKSYLQSKVKNFNSKLSKALVALRTTYPDITIYSSDIYLGEKTILKNFKQDGLHEKIS